MKTDRVLHAVWNLPRKEFMNWLESTNGISIDQINPPTGTTALHAAAMLHNLNAVHTLIKAGANVNLKSKRGRTPLFDACGDVSYHPANLKILRVLLKSGAKVNTRDKAGWTPLSLAVVNAQATIVAVLLRAGARITADAKEHAWSNYFMLEFSPKDDSQRAKAIRKIYNMLGRPTNNQSVTRAFSWRRRSQAA